MNPFLEFLLSSIYDGSGLHPEHLTDLRKSGLTDETIRRQKIRSVPPDMIDQILGFPAPKVMHAYVIPFPDPRGGWMDHVRLKVFSNDDTAEVRGDHVETHRERYRYNRGRAKYLVRRQSTPRLYFPITTMPRALESEEPLWLVEGCKKALATMQLGLPVIGLEGPWSWHLKASSALLPDFSLVQLRGRVVELVPDSDVRTNRSIAWATRLLADALRAVGARPRLVQLPHDVKGADDFIEASRRS